MTWTDSTSRYFTRARRHLGPQHHERRARNVCCLKELWKMLRPEWEQFHAFHQQAARIRLVDDDQFLLLLCKFKRSQADPDEFPKQCRAWEWNDVPRSFVLLAVHRGLMRGRDWLEKSIASCGGNRPVVRLSRWYFDTSNGSVVAFCAIGWAFNTVAAEGATDQGVPPLIVVGSEVIKALDFKYLQRLFPPSTNDSYYLSTISTYYGSRR